MANSFVIWSLAWLGTSLVFTGLPLCIGQATGICKTVNPCRCTYRDGSFIDLRKISKIGKFMFDYAPSRQPASPFYYAYNPCYPVTDTKDCENVAACQKDPYGPPKHFPLGYASSANFTGADSNIAITYSATDHSTGILRILRVTLVCDKTISTPRLDILGETAKTVYNYTLTSKHCCPKRYQAVVYSYGLSFGSILCIIFSCLLFGYLVASCMKYISKAEGKEVIPNYSM